MGGSILKGDYDVLKCDVTGCNALYWNIEGYIFPDGCMKLLCNSCYEKIKTVIELKSYKENIERTNWD